MKVANSKIAVATFKLNVSFYYKLGINPNMKPNLNYHLYILFPSHTISEFRINKKWNIIYIFVCGAEWFGDSLLYV